MRRALQLCMRQSGGAALMRVAGLSSRARADSADGSHSESDADGMRPLSVSSHSWQARQSAVPLLRNHKRAATLTKLLAPGGNARTVRWKEVEALLEQGLGAQLTVHYPQRKNTAKEKCRAAVAYPGATWKAMMHELDDDDPDDLFAAAMAAAAEEAMAEQEEATISNGGFNRFQPGKGHHSRPPTHPSTKVHLKVVLNGERQSFSRPQWSDTCLSVEEVVDVRHLLKRAGVLDGHEGAHTAAHEQATHNPVVSDGKHVVLLMDHQSAEVYSDLLSGAAPAAELTPEDPKGYRRQLRSKRHFKKVGSVFRGDRAPEDSGYYEEIAKLLTGYDEVVLAGHATGLKADARQVLLAHLRRKHKAVASSVVGELTADKHTTRNQLLAAARELYHDLHPL